MPLTADSAAPPFRLVRTVAISAMSWVGALSVGLAGWAGPASAASGTAATASPATAGPATTGTPGADVTALQTQAQELAAQITADGRALDELDSSYQAAQINLVRLTARQADLHQQMGAASAAVAQARAALKQQALLAYLTGGAPVVGAVPARPGADPGIGIAYAEIVTGGQKRAVDAYRATLDAMARRQAALDATTQQVKATLTTIKSDAAQAAVTLTAQRQALAQVKGQLAIEVARVQARQQAAEQAQERAALAAQGQLPAAGQETAPTAPPTTDPPSPAAPRPASPSTTSPRRGTTSTTSATSATSATTAPPAPSPTTTVPPSGGGSGPAQAPGVNRVLAYARAQLGKPYQWGGAGPDSFDCSGLVMMAWEQAGIFFPHLAQSQYDLTARIPLSALIPGDLVFFGTPDNVYHVGIYIGSGDMIDAPETGQDVSIQSIYWDSLLGGGRVTTSS